MKQFSYILSLTATTKSSPCPPECHFQSETKIEPDLNDFTLKLGLIPGYLIFKVSPESIVTHANEKAHTLNRPELSLFLTRALRIFISFRVGYEQIWSLLRPS